MASAARPRPLQKVELFHFQLPGTAFDDVLREIAIMRKLDHVNVVNMHDVIDDVFANKLYSAPARGPEPARPPGPRGPYILCRSRRRPRASAQW